MRGRVERAARKNFAGGFLASPPPANDQCSRNPDGIELGELKHRGNHETEYVREPQWRAGVDNVGNWRRDGQVLPSLCRLRRSGRGGRVLLVGFHWALHNCDERPSDVVLSAGTDYAPQKRNGAVGP